ncbi:hypothetical protein L6164_034956 [Bauhinia variegata]|uniref:Uncharacterized protein n=1 Tax=Bauhinia variegata TaxID=167791 RepID=A0ACB9KW51_BAUVA|nr:hypothetical protein L6164_034956 [Bauhinia variegata]
MKIATYANARTTLAAGKGIGKAFITAFQSGAVMGFLLTANGLLVLYISINLFKLYYGDDWEGLYESITGYGLGGSSMALFGRVVGGIYTTAADVGADLVGKVERDIPEDDPRNPAVIAESSAWLPRMALLWQLWECFSTIATGLAIDACGPISDNVGGIAEMAGMSHETRERTDALDAAGNTTAAIGKVAFPELYTVFHYTATQKSFNSGTALIEFHILTCAFSSWFCHWICCLLSLALFGAYVIRAGIKTVDVLAPKVFIGLIVGAMLPYWFSAMTMKCVGSAALKMVEEVRPQFNSIPGLTEGRAKPDYANCVKISTNASLKEMVPPGALVMLSPFVAGTFFGVETLAGALVSEAGASEHAVWLGPKGSDAHKAAVFMAVESLVFAPFFASHGGLIFKLL